jgi:predicted DCC family thiol-disulfide oxidoreductase YuxK
MSIEPVSDFQKQDGSCPIVFFDGVCGFCNYSVNWLLVRDPGHRLRFAPLQGPTAALKVPDDIRNRLDTLVFLRDGRIYIRTAAVARILMTLGGRWWIFGAMLWIIPFPLRDLGYRIVARLRYRLFGKRDSCRMPSPSERAVFLD